MTVLGSLGDAGYGVLLLSDLSPPYWPIALWERPPSTDRIDRTPALGETGPVIHPPGPGHDVTGSANRICRQIGQHGPA